MEHSFPLVSIITPCYNGSRFINRFFQSVLAQSYPRIELYFVDDGSTDDTGKIALSYQAEFEDKYGEDSFHYIYQENAGQAAAINSVLPLIQGEYLTWPDSDDIMYPNCLETKVDYLESHPDIGLAICQIAVVDESDLDREIGLLQRNNTTEQYVFEDMVYYRDIYNMPIGWMIRSAGFLSINPKRKIYPGRGGQNWQLLMPMAYYYKCGVISQVLGKCVVRSDSHYHTAENDPIKYISRCDGYEDVTVHAIKSIKMTRKEKKMYLSYIREFFGRRKFTTAYEVNDKRTMNKEFWKLLSINCVDRKFIKAYLEVCHKFLYWFIICFSDPKRIYEIIKNKRRNR